MRKYEGMNNPKMYIRRVQKSIRSVNTGGGVAEIKTSPEGNEIYRW